MAEEPKNGHLVAWRLERLEEFQKSAQESLEEVKVEVVEFKSIREDIKKLEGKLDHFNKWLMAGLGSVVVSLILLIFDLAFKKH